MAGFWGKHLSWNPEGILCLCSLVLLHLRCSCSQIPFNNISMYTHVTYPWVELSPLSVLDSEEMLQGFWQHCITSKIRITTCMVLAEIVLVSEGLGVHKCIYTFTLHCCTAIMWLTTAFKSALLPWWLW